MHWRHGCVFRDGETQGSGTVFFASYIFGKEMSDARTFSNPEQRPNRVKLLNTFDHTVSNMMVVV